MKISVLIIVISLYKLVGIVSIYTQRQTKIITRFTQKALALKSPCKARFQGLLIIN